MRSLCFLVILFPLLSFSQEGKNIRSLTISATYTSLPWYNLKGGIDQGFVYMDNADLSATLQFGNILDWDDNLTFYIYGIGNHGGKATSLMGDFQVASNIEAPDSWKLFEAWIQKNLMDGRYSILAGMYDLNSEFDILMPALTFINSSFGIGAEYAQSGINSPSIFPYSSLAIRVASSIGDRLLFKIAVLDAVPGDPERPKENPVIISREEGALFAGELSLFTGKDYKIGTGMLEREDVSRRIKVGRKKPENNLDKMNLGFWAYTSDFRFIDDSSRMDHGNFGVYLGGQKYVYLDFKESKYLGLFLRYGIARSRFNRVSNAISGGVSFHELLGHDQLGVAFTSAFNSHYFLRENSDYLKTETTIELCYTFYLKDYLTLQPDIQYVINPDMRDDLPNALSIALLAQISFDY